MRIYPPFLTFAHPSCRADLVGFVPLYRQHFEGVTKMKETGAFKMGGK